MEPTSLTNFYDDLKKEISHPVQPMLHVGFGPGGMNPDAQVWHHKAMKNCNELKDKCRKHILLDVYCKILPLDKDFIDGHKGDMSADIDGMLAAKGMTPTQYLTSCSESTSAPLISFILNATDEIGRQYMEKQDETLKDGQENNIDLPDPEVPETDDPEVQSQLVDIENDMEYDDFVEKLKKKTIDKIVDDVSSIIAGEKQDKDMSFDPVQESTVGVAMDYLQKKLWNESVSEEEQEEMIGLAIRESTLHEFDCVFDLAGKTYNEYCNRVRLGKGYVINESALNVIKFTESTAYNRHFDSLKAQFNELKSKNHALHEMINELKGVHKSDEADKAIDKINDALTKNFEQMDALRQRIKTMRPDGEGSGYNSSTKLGKKITNAIATKKELEEERDKFNSDSQAYAIYQDYIDKEEKNIKELQKVAKNAKSSMKAKLNISPTDEEKDQKIIDKVMNEFKKLYA